MAEEGMDPLREHKEANERLENEARSLSEMGELLVRLGEGLRADPVGVRLANTDLKRPIELPDGNVIDYARIPTPETVKEGLGKYYSAWLEDQATLQKLPPDEQQLFLGQGNTRPPRRVRVIRQPRV